jgi:hypothetical protein
VRTHARNLRVLDGSRESVGRLVSHTGIGIPSGADAEAFNSAPDGRRRYEIFSSGIDETFQSVGVDPYLGISNFGLRVPFLPTAAPAKRYLFNLASFTLAEGQRAQIIGYRMFWSLGVRLGPHNGPFTFIEQPVEQPGFYLPDGNVSWHMHRIAHNEVPVPNQGPVVPPLRSTAFRMSDNPALLFDTLNPDDSTFYVNLLAYTPPNLGRPWGTMLKNNLGTMLDLRTQWRTHGGWHAMGMPVDGPCTVAFFASVQQTNAANRVVPPLPPDINGLSDEWGFVLNFPTSTETSTGALIWRVAGALIVEDG